MRAYKFLRPGGIGPFSGFAWPNGDWVEAGGPDLCVRGVHACRQADLPYWITGELWEMELDGAIREEERKLVAERGRLVRRVEAWDALAGRRFAEAFARRTRERAEASTGGRADEIAGFASDAAANAATGEVALIGFIAARAAEVDGGESAYAAEREAQAAWLASELGLAEA
jgi:hypothetical protein